MKLLVDTNIWISYFICGSFDEFSSILNNNKHEIVFSQLLLQEITAVLRRPKFKKHLFLGQVQEIEKLLLLRGTEYSDSDKKVPVIPDDPKDIFMIHLAVESNADFLITGDDDLLRLKQVNNTLIVNFKEFIEKFSEDT